MIRGLIVVLLGISVLIMSLIAWFYFHQERLVFFPEKLAQDFSFNFAAPFREANIELNSGEKISYLVFNEKSTKGSILYFHGNAGSLRDWGFVASELAKQTGWAVWIMDYPGYGKSSGRLPKNEKVLLAMGQALYSKIAQEKPHLPMVLFGRSIGSGIATMLAVNNATTGLILESPYRSIAKLGKEIYPFLPEAFSRFDLDNENVLMNANNLPVLMLHGTADEVIPITHSEVLSRLNPQTKLVVIQNASHNNLDQFAQYWPAVQKFLSRLTHSHTE